MKKGLLGLVLVFLGNSMTLMAERHSYTASVHDHQVYVTEWSYGQKLTSDTTVLLLSGPTDNWNSDSAWFARLAPKLAKDFRVISVDRAGQLSDNPNAPIGYAQFGDDLRSLMPRFKSKNIHVIAFATANLALHQYLANNQHHPIKSVIMIDPDVLLPYSVSRYKSDAQGYKDNLQEYLDYIGEGRYKERAQQKNKIDMEHLKKLAGDDKDTDWAYVEQVFKSRLSIVSLQNQFKEIAGYGSDLDIAVKAGFPTDIPLVVLDTDFEDGFIAKAEKAEDKQGLGQWKTEAATYYQQLAKRSVKGQYIHLSTEEHLIPFSDPDRLIKLVKRLSGAGK